MAAISSTIPSSTPVHPRPPFLRRWTQANPQVGLCGNHDHVAIIYDNPDDQLDFVVPFLRLGLERGEKSIFIYDDNSAETVIAAMESHGIDVAAASSTGALSIITKNHAYLKNGDFDPDWMIDFLAQAVDDAKKEGFPAVRASGEMTWALGPASEPHDRLIEYECKLSAFFPNYDLSGICQYNRRRFRPETLMHVIHTHPKVVFHGYVCENPYYLPAEILRSEGGEFAQAIRRLLEGMSETTRLRNQLADESEALRRSESLAIAGRMAAFVAREINNPLEAITNAYDLLEQQDLPASAKKELAILGAELDRVCQISKRTLDALGLSQSAHDTHLAKLD